MKNVYAEIHGENLSNKEAMSWCESTNQQLILMFVSQVPTVGGKVKGDVFILLPAKNSAI